MYLVGYVIQKRWCVGQASKGLISSKKHFRPPRERHTAIQNISTAKMTKKPAVSLLNVAIQYTLSFYKHLSLYSNQPFSIEIGRNYYSNVVLEELKIDQAGIIYMNETH